MDFFNFYSIPIRFKVDESALKRTFLKNSRLYHPDFHTGATEDEQEKMLQLSTQNNEAYKVLKDADKRMKYILELKGAYQEGDNIGNKLPADFLMEMMDLNEQLMELEFDPNPSGVADVGKMVQSVENELLSEVQLILDDYDGAEEKAGDLEKVKIFFLKKRYLLRIKEKLFTFASASEKEAL